MTDEGVIDHSVLDELSETMGEDFADELITTFLEEAPGMLAELRQARTDQDAEAFRRAAHSIKSNANVFGAVLLAEKARALELADMSQPAMTAQLADFDTAYDRTIAALKEVTDG